MELCSFASEEEGKLVAAVRTDDFTKDRLGLSSQLHLDSDLVAEEAQPIRDLVLEFADVFALGAAELGSTDLVTHTIDTGDSPPVKQQARRVPFALHQVVEDIVGNMGGETITEPMVQSSGAG